MRSVFDRFKKKKGLVEDDFGNNIEHYRTIMGP